MAIVDMLIDIIFHVIVGFQLAICVLAFMLTYYTMQIARKHAGTGELFYVPAANAAESQLLCQYMHYVFCKETSITSVFFWKVYLLHCVPYIWIFNMPRYGYLLHRFVCGTAGQQYIYPIVMRHFNSDVR